MFAFLLLSVGAEPAPAFVVENHTPPAFVVENRTAPVIRITPDPAPVQYRQVCGPTGCSLVPVTSSPVAAPVVQYTYTSGACAVASGGDGWWLFKRLGRGKPAFRR